MATRAQRLRNSHVIAILALGGMVSACDAAGATTSEQALDWSIHAAKDAYYPGEPVALMVTLDNRGSQPEVVHFEDDLEVASVEIRNLSGEALTKGRTVNRPEGGPRPTSLQVPAGQTATRQVVLNRWCSTLLLPPGAHAVVCRVNYRLDSEESPQAVTTVRRAGPVHTSELRLNIKIAPMEVQRFKKMLEDLRTQAFPTMFMEKMPSLQEEYDAREMLALTESTLAVPYQLEVLAGGGATYGFHWDAIESLARSKTVDAAIVLMRLAEQRQFEHVTRDLVEAVYRIREGGQPEIIAATDEFTQKHKRSAWRWHQIERDLPN